MTKLSAADPWTRRSARYGDWPRSVHRSGERNAPPGVAVTRWYGQAGVTLFFALSGFLITHLLLQERARTGAVSLGGFYRRRALRILPVWFAYVGSMALLAVVGFVDVPVKAVIAATTFLWNMSPWADSTVLAHGWSLAIEEQFYLLWPAAFLLLLRGRNPVRGLTGLVALSPVLHAAAYFGLPGLRHTGLLGTQDRYDQLLVGCLLAFALRDHRELVTRIARPWVAGLGAGLLLIVQPVVTGLLPYDTGNPLMVVAGLTLMGMCATVVLAAVLTGNFVSVLSHRGLVWLGLISYSVYVWQQVFFYSPLNVFPLNITGAIGAGWLSYVVIERASNRVRARLRDRTAVLRAEVRGEERLVGVG